MSTVAKQAVGEALDTLTNKVFDHYFTRKENDLMQQQQLVASLFQNQMNLENEYRNQLLDAGVSLPQEFQSGNYIDIVNNAGNQPLLDTLNELYAQSTMNLDNLMTAKSSFTRGQRIAETYAGGTDVDGDGTVDVGAFTEVCIPDSKVVPSFGGSILGAKVLPTAPNIIELATEIIALCASLLVIPMLPNIAGA